MVVHCFYSVSVDNQDCHDTKTFCPKDLQIPKKKKKKKEKK